MQKSSEIPTVQEKLETSSQRVADTTHADNFLGVRLQQSRREGTRLEKQQTVTRFIERQQTKIREKQEQTKLRETIEGKASLFAEEFSKFKVRDYSNNTRMNIKNQDYANMR